MYIYIVYKFDNGPPNASNNFTTKVVCFVQSNEQET